MLFERDPEDIGTESDEDLSFRMDLNESIHEFDPDPATGKCRGYLIRNGMQGAQCNSTQKWSVFHDNSDDPQDKFMEGGSHWHGGGDCMCFEEYDW